MLAKLANFVKREVQRQSRGMRRWQAGGTGTLGLTGQSVLTVSIQEAGVFERLERDFGWERLIQLQQGWREVYGNVRKVQPTDQPDFDGDISMDSPLLID